MNQKKTTLTVLFLLIIALLIVPVHASDSQTIEFFYEIGCKNCEKARPILKDFASENNLSIVEYEISSPSGIEKMDRYGIYVVPAVVISGQVISYPDYGGDLSTLKDLLNQSMHRTQVSQNQTQISNQTGQANQTDQTRTRQPPIKLSVPAVFVAGLIAGFNPCLLAILAFITSVMLSSGRTNKRMLWMILVFCAGIFITYLIAGFGLLEMVGHTEGTRGILEGVLIGIIVLLGIWHIYDAYHVKKYNTSSFRTSGSIMRSIENLVQKESVPAIFLLGVLFSLVKAPCVGGMYILILNTLLRDGGICSALYLGVYNLGVIFPVLALGLAITFGMQPESVNRYKDEHRGLIRFVTGVLLLAIAVLMEIGMV